MGHITNQYGPYYFPIWAILLSNMSHITDPRHSHKTYKSYKTHKYHSANKPLLPPYGGTEGGFSGELRGLQYEQQE